ncbi:MAG: hypothetical protein R3F36_12475 [Candidatus Competibacteraceae bacterium]
MNQQHALVIQRNMTITKDEFERLRRGGGNRGLVNHGFAIAL